MYVCMYVFMLVINTQVCGIQSSANNSIKENIIGKQNWENKAFWFRSLAQYPIFYSTKLEFKDIGLIKEAHNKLGLLLGYGMSSLMEEIT